MAVIRAADLFCGAGGASTGLFQAADRLGRKLQLVAVNHWERAVETHSKNHPKAAHHCEDLLTLDPTKAVPGGRLDLLVAAPECTHHSNARGGKPLKSRRGETFRAWVKALESLGYRVDYRVLNSADYGAATSRRRLFVQAVKGRRPIVWPDPTHARRPEADGLFADRLPWRGAREVIDWTLTGESIFTRKRPLSANTLRRIETGLRKFGGAAAKPFLVAMNYLAQPGHDARYCRSAADPLPTVTGQGNRFALCEPFTVRVANQGDDNCRVKSTDDPLGTVTGRNTTGLVQPFLVPTFNGERQGQAPRCHSVDAPHPTVVASRPTHGLVEPFILPHRQHDRMDVDDVGLPMRTITAVNGGNNALVQPFVLPYYANGSAESVADPLRTVTARDRFGLVTTDGRVVDIRFRMLQPHELAAAMGFPAGYELTGNRADRVRQVGNAIEVNQARALALAMLESA